ncbi:MAG: hypothetical protein HY586_08200 [Candidatus Omnitrophica bacterium]|nr:hypothetical protein [Candidatus Omnitrophota bacterium]
MNKIHMVVFCALLTLPVSGLAQAENIATPAGEISQDDWEDAGLSGEKKPGIFEEWMGGLFEKVSPGNLSKVDPEKQKKAEEVLGFNR